MGLPAIIRLAPDVNSGVTIHDLRSDLKEAGLHLSPPVAGEAPRVYHIKDMFGEKVLRASQGLRAALQKGLIVEVKESELEALEKTVNPETLTDRLEKATGKVPARRKAGEKAAAAPSKNPALMSEINAHVQQENVYDQALKEKREELKHDIVG